MNARHALLGVALALAGQVQANSQTVFLIRHAEKAVEPAGDPMLSETGAARAARLPALFANALPAAVFSTQYQRTRLTAQPLADAAGISITVIAVGKDNADSYPQQVLEAICSLPDAATAVVVGHSNTVPAMVSAWTGEPVPAIAEYEFDRLFMVKLRDCAGVDWSELRY
jgi:broad specificity phosphatase PhoE